MRSRNPVEFNDKASAQFYVLCVGVGVGVRDSLWNGNLPACMSERIRRPDCSK